MPATAVKERPIIFSGESVRAILEGRKTMTRRVVNGDVPGDADEVFVWPSVYPMDYHKNPGLWARKHNTVDEIDECSGDGWIRDLCRNPYGWPGDRLWLKERWRMMSWRDGEPACIQFADESLREVNAEDISDDCEYEDWLDRMTEQSAADCEKAGLECDSWEGYQFEVAACPTRWRPSIHMPRWASRIDLETLKVRVERLQEISEEDAIAEGVPDMFLSGHGHYGTACTEWFRGLWDEINTKRGFPWESNPWVWVVEFKMIRE